MTSQNLNAAVESHLHRGDVAGAHALCADALAVARVQGERRAEADAEFGLATCALQEDAFDEGIVAAARAIAIYSTLGEPAAEATCRALVSRILQISGETGDALEEGVRALALAEQTGDHQSQYSALMALTNVHLALAQWEPAIAHCERAAEMARLLEDDWRQGRALDTLGCVWGGMAHEARENGDESRARSCATESIALSERAREIARRIGYRRLEGTALANLAENMAFLGRLDEAQTLLSGWPVDAAHDSTFTVTHHLDTWGGICLRLGQHAQAAALFRRALAIAESKSTEMQLNEHLADALERSGDSVAALEHFRRFHALSMQSNSELAHRSARVAAVKMETAAALTRAAELSRANEQLNQHARDLMRLTLEDPLTGLPNRRALDRALGTGEQRWALALIDIDHFKHVNDTYSHLIGDEVLRHLANLLRRCCRDLDLPVRWGGEEFAILLRQLDESSASAAAEPVRAMVETYDWTSVAKGLAVTVSIGVAASGAARSMEQVFAEADQRLYSAKRGGRNRVIA